MSDNFGDFNDLVDDGFGDDFDSGFGNTDGGFGDDFDSGFGDSDDMFSSAGQSDGSQSNEFGDSLSNFDSQASDVQADQSRTKKQSIIFILAGVAVLIVVFIIAGAINKKAKSNSNSNRNVDRIMNDSNRNVDSIMNEGNKNAGYYNKNTNSQNIVTNQSNNGFNWKTITNKEKVQFNDEYSDMIFTVTNIEHKARAVDTNNNLVVITTIQGSISGLSGTYELNIPYDKGVKLVVGNNFTVHVQLGTYNGKTVVGEIQY